MTASSGTTTDANGWRHYRPTSSGGWS